MQRSLLRGEFGVCEPGEEFRGVAQRIDGENGDNIDRTNATHQAVRHRQILEWYLRGKHVPSVVLTLTGLTERRIRIETLRAKPNVVNLGL